MIPLNRSLSDLRQSPIRAFTALAKSTPDCVSLAIGEPDFDTPENIKAAAIAALQANDTHYAPNQGTAALREAAARFEKVRPEQVLITIGATQALFTALFGILNPGEEVILPTPGFGLYESIATIAGAKIVPLDLTKNHFQIDGAALEALITPRTKAIILNSPNNPTGVILNEDSLAAVKKAVLGKDIFVICDNVYRGLSYGPCPDLSKDEELRDQILICQSFSKPWAMTGWRIGYLICPEYVMDRLKLLSAAAITAVPTFLQEAAVTALSTSSEDMKQAYEKRRDYVCGRLKSMGLSFPEPEGAFYVFVDIRKFGMDSETFCTRMIREAKVAAVPGSCFGTEGFIRISYCYSDEELKKGLDRMEKFVADFM